MRVAASMRISSIASTRDTAWMIVRSSGSSVSKMPPVTGMGAMLSSAAALLSALIASK